MSDLSIRVVKVGGSLFELPELGKRITTWLKIQSPAYNLLVAGGGKLVDEIRMQQLDERTAHWQCIEILEKTAISLASKLPGVSIVDLPPGFKESQPNCATVFSPSRWLREVEPNLPGTRLRESWEVTSDSIAARLTICFHRAELVLLKSADAPCLDFTKLAECRYVDRMFPEFAQELPVVRMVNLRQFPGES
ncbi:amino acid kinase family protein [Bythopirellula goksoeyrii]|uniref:Amino acid kinase family protein n=1 Tax=Bythopirellula goksoeyrii TaxID=1400387 RepID=A0A5B9QCM1_9BACT|nr:hypothetical protein [Bythopirellula goksoeyrii]QEG35549.1 hypothetical protein Pr1d_28500 [Bythopirellula goksoeyrii]